MRGSAGRARIAARAAQIEGVFIAFPKRNVYKYRVLYTSRAYAHQYRNRRRLTRRGYGRGRSLIKKATVEEALRTLVRRHRRRAAIADMIGLGWQGDLDALREGRSNEPLP